MTRTFGICQNTFEQDFFSRTSAPQPERRYKTRTTGHVERAKKAAGIERPIFFSAHTADGQPSDVAIPTRRKHELGWFHYKAQSSSIIRSIASCWDSRFVSLPGWVDRMAI